METVHTRRLTCPPPLISPSDTHVRAVGSQNAAG